jgi:hypothetical protein
VQRIHGKATLTADEHGVEQDGQQLAYATWRARSRIATRAWSVTIWRLHST